MSPFARRIAVTIATACLALPALGCGLLDNDGEPDADTPVAAEPELAKVDPCTLITAAEAKPYVRGDYFQNRFGTSTAMGAKGQQCTYLVYADGGDDAEVAVMISEDPWTPADLKERVDKWVRGPEDSVEPLAGVGDEAYIMVSKDFGEAWVRIGNRAIAVHVTDREGGFLKEPTRSLTKLAASRFPRG